MTTPADYLPRPKTVVVWGDDSAPLATIDVTSNAPRWRWRCHSCSLTVRSGELLSEAMTDLASHLAREHGQ